MKLMDEGVPKLAERTPDAGPSTVHESPLIWNS